MPRSADIDRRETSRDEPEVPPRESRGQAALWWALVVLLVFGTALCWGAIAFVRELSARTQPFQEDVSVRSSGEVLRAVRDLARLETASFHMERVVELTSNQKRLFGLIEAEDTILLVASADIVAGVDLAALGDDDLELDAEAGTARVRLPHAIVLSSHLDEEHTFVHGRRTDLLARRREDLETLARRDAVQTLARSAIEAGILTRAEQSAERVIRSLVESLGYEDVEIEFE